MKKIMLVFGTRPEAIKMAPLAKELQKHSEDFQTIICLTGQHREMLDQVMNLFDLHPDYDLNIMQKGQDLYDITTRVLTGMKKILEQAQPDIVLVHGDTTTSMATALAAFYQHIDVGHVEAGLRTNNIYSPWPEEMNRQITGRIAKYNFAPTSLSKENLEKENTQGKIYVTGNTVIDALHMITKKLGNDTTLANEQKKILLTAGYDISRLQNEKKLILITGHRRENFGCGFLNILKAIKHLSKKYPNVDFVYPMHLNPNVRRPIAEIFCDNTNGIINQDFISKHTPNIFFIEPLQYMEFVYLMEKAYIVLTDSGGIQEEAPGLGKPVLVMRDTTERPEALEAGTVHLVGTNYDLIISEVSDLLNNPTAYERMSKATNPYGDGKASSRIVKILKDIENTKE
ncbi:MAG: UDP-N-acetylglucosamine 2-epimerase (non-hydrolyzing) [Prevotella sp.]|nr:UDP-N-acetylglucosamine 2-epimerase (non-hydrolyzing) [Prevotella sp.]